MLNDRLKAVRESLGYTKKQVGDHLAITPEGYGHYESGNRKPTPETIVTLAKLFDVSTDYLLCNSDTKKEPTASDSELFSVLEARPILLEIAQLLAQLDDAQLASLAVIVKGLTGQP